MKPFIFHSFEDFYNTGILKLLDNEVVAVKVMVDTNRSLFDLEADNLQIAKEYLEQNVPMEDAWAEIFPETELKRLECAAEKEEDAEVCDKIIPDLLSLIEATHLSPFQI